MRSLLEFLVQVSRNPLILLISFASVVLMPSFHFDRDRELYFYMVVAGIPWIIFLASIKYARNDEDVFVDDGFNK